jgi:hypothetical protein
MTRVGNGRISVYKHASNKLILYRTAPRGTLWASPRASAASRDHRWITSRRSVPRWRCQAGALKKHVGPSQVFLAPRGLKNGAQRVFGGGFSRNTPGRPKCFLPLEGSKTERSEFLGVGSQETRRAAPSVSCPSRGQKRSAASFWGWALKKHAGPPQVFLAPRGVKNGAQRVFGGGLTSTAAIHRA